MSGQLCRGRLERYVVEEVKFMYVFNRPFAVKFTELRISKCVCVI